MQGENFKNRPTIEELEAEKNDCSGRHQERRSERAVGTERGTMETEEVTVVPSQADLFKSI